MASDSATAPASGASTTIVTQTRVSPEHAADFAAWQQDISAAVTSAPGFISAEVLPPSPPVQPDWVVMQRFTSNQAAQAWLASPERARLLAKAQPWLVGHDDIHLFQNAAQPDSSAVSLMISPG